MDDTDPLVARVTLVTRVRLGRRVLIHPGAVLGAGGTWAQDIIWANQVLAEKGVRRIGPYKVTSTMGNSVSACLATAFGSQGVNYTVTSACSTSSSGAPANSSSRTISNSSPA